MVHTYRQQRPKPSFRSPGADFDSSSKPFAHAASMIPRHRSSCRRAANEESEIPSDNSADTARTPEQKIPSKLPAPANKSYQLHKIPKAHSRQNSRLPAQKNGAAYGATRYCGKTARCAEKRRDFHDTIFAALSSETSIQTPTGKRTENGASYDGNLARNSYRPN